MTLVHRVLYPRPIISLEDYVARGGGKGIKAAVQMGPAETIERVLASGLRGRGGAGFPTGRKWQTVAANRSPVTPTTVIVNAAEGEPGTFKDRTILRRNPYVVVEGALIAARAVAADLIIIAMKQAFSGEIDRTRAAIEEIADAGWSEGITVAVFEGPDEYLYGEESALLETIDGRWPFPRVVPTFRRGLRGTQRIDTPEDAPALVNNTETLANVARITARGPAWFRTAGTEQSPGTMVCTITGSTRRHGVGEVDMGTPLREVIAAVGGGPRRGHEVKAVLSGVANRIITGDQLDVPVSYEGMSAIGSGLGSGAFIVFDDSDDMTAVAAGVARFLAVESCGQCSPCKLDGITLSKRLALVSETEATVYDVAEIEKRIGTVADRSRCFLATQQQVVLESILEQFPREFESHVAGAATAVEPVLIAELLDIRDGKAILDERHRRKQPDWSYHNLDSGSVPVELYTGRTPPWRDTPLFAAIS
ncbi:MAG TPA: NADH-ubiquinone oxidoreductase-F iron-sulfur binding region domain-containing protein [Acidimicrobiales bacterium]|jgi:NADH:ubiquinone oxidoreductase subunit F (NADH-binding)|nr:NADH-ubiquinone oxidoreductase-F iron-sulfur binding region domain-containing protein [Acidimicrobiales bacterium]